jgi:hypothetical protein
MNAITMLERDHVKVKALLARLDSTTLEGSGDPPRHCPSHRGLPQAVRPCATRPRASRSHSFEPTELLVVARLRSRLLPNTFMS